MRDGQTEIDRERERDTEIEINVEKTKVRRKKRLSNAGEKDVICEKTDMVNFNIITLRLKEELDFLGLYIKINSFELATSGNNKKKEKKGKTGIKNYKKH